MGTVLLLLLLSQEMVVVSSAPMTIGPLQTVVNGVCRVGSNWSCQKQNAGGGRISSEVAEVCEVCGRYWANVLGLTYCCRCNDQVFEFCWEAVRGQPLDGHLIL